MATVHVPTPEEMQAAEARLANPLAHRTEVRVRARSWFAWEDEMTSARSVSEFRDALLAAVRTLPREQRSAELDAILRELDPSCADMVLSETRRLVADGHPAPRALQAALGAVLVGRRKKHWLVLVNEVIPFQAQKVAAGIFAVSPDPAERASRIERLVQLLRPEEALPFVPEDARVRLHEFGLSAAEIARALSAPRVTAHDIAQQLSTDMARHVPPQTALERALTRAMYEYALEHFKAKPVALGAEFCVVASAIIGGLGLVASVVGMAVPLARQGKAERRARRAEERQRNAPLMTGEIESLVGQMLQDPSNTRWNDRLRNITLDYIRVNRPGRTAFVEPEARIVQETFERLVRERRDQQRAQERQQQAQQRQAEQQAQQAQQQATSSRNTKIAVGVAVGAVVLIGGALVYRSKK